MNVRIDKHNQLNWLVVEPQDDNKTGPILLYLHGRGAASVDLNKILRVLANDSPPFQAIMGRLADVTVVAPQAPYDYNPEKKQTAWDWNAYLNDIHAYLLERFPNRKILGTGFSRGGLG